MTAEPGPTLARYLSEATDGNFEFLDNFKNTITGRQRFFPSATVLAGKRVPRV